MISNSFCRKLHFDELDFLLCGYSCFSILCFIGINFFHSFLVFIKARHLIFNIGSLVFALDARIVGFASISHALRERGALVGLRNLEI